MRKLRITGVATFYFFWKALVQKKGSETTEGRERGGGDINTTGDGRGRVGRPLGAHWVTSERSGQAWFSCFLRWGTRRWLRFPVASGTKPHDLGADDTRNVLSGGSGARSPR